MTTIPPRGSKSPFSKPLILTKCRRIPLSSGMNQGNWISGHRLSSEIFFIIGPASSQTKTPCGGCCCSTRISVSLAHFTSQRKQTIDGQIDCQIGRCPSSSGDGWRRRQRPARAPCPRSTSATLPESGKLRSFLQSMSGRGD